MRPPSRPRPATPRPAPRVARDAQARPGTERVAAPDETLTQPLELRGQELVPVSPSRPLPRKPGGRPVTGQVPVPPSGGAGGRSTARPTDRVVSTGMADRLAEKAAMRRHRVRRTILIWVASVLAVAAVAWVVLFSPVLGTDPEKIEITGEGTVIDVAQVQQVVSGVSDVPLPRVDTIGLREQILSLNGVRDVTILREWPDGLSVTLESREPVAAVPHDGSYVLLDRDGVQVLTVEAVPEGIPEIGVSLDDEGARSLRAARIVLNALPPELRAEVAEVTAGTQDAVEMRLRDGAVVEWGNGEDAALKVKVLQTLRSLPENQGVTLYDVSAPTMPITR